MNKLPILLEDAQQMICSTVGTTEVINIPLFEAIGYVLAEPIRANIDVPHFEKSMLDGFAVRAEDIRDASIEHPIRLEVLETVPAGHVPTRQVTQGKTIRIMTGAMMPEGADAVCRFEMTRHSASEAWVEVLMPVASGEAISRVGEDVRLGASILFAGNRIGAAEMGMLATFGYEHVKVFRKPVVGILSSGTELIGVGEPLAPGKIRNSNSYMLASQVIAAGGLPRTYQPVSDDVESIAATILQASKEVDMLVTTGGVSVGDYDFMHASLDRIEANKLFWKVLIRPGAPVLFAEKEGFPIICLSGNPAAAFVNAELFLLPALRKMGGYEAVFRPVYYARICNVPIKKVIKPTRFLRGMAFFKGTELCVDFSGSQGAGVLSSFLGTNCLVRIEGGQIPQAGDTARIQLFGEIAQDSIVSRSQAVESNS